MIRVFVYGTLKRGGSNHALLGRGCFLGEFVTAPVYTMLSLGDYPGIIDGGATAISGEVYNIDPGLLHELDLLEDYPVEYTRRQIITPWGRAWIYLLRRPSASLPIVADGYWQV